MQQRYKPLLIIAQSGRALAASAGKAGITSHVLDRFADTDTQSLAARCDRVACSDGEIDLQQLQACINSYHAGSLYGIVAGSGLEAHSSFIAGLQERLPWYGNRADVWRICGDAGAFAGLLLQLGIRSPRISTEHPATTTGWLQKREFSSGGEHVHYASAGRIKSEQYFQEIIRGRHISVVFMADGREFVIVGMCDTEVVDRETGDFRHAGAVTTAGPGPAVLQQLWDMLAGLTEHLGLVGLCGIDVVIDSRNLCWLLELNPRPTATFALHEQHDDSLLAAHIHACGGELPPVAPVPGCRGHRIFFAPVEFLVPAVNWPDWVTDRPAAGEIIHAGVPVCTVHAYADTPAQVQQHLQSRLHQLAEMMIRRHRAA